MCDRASFKYSAFLSYAHHDEAWAKWLHRALERFKIDKDLAHRVTTAGPVPRTLRPIFRDREDFAGGQNLATTTVTAIDNSAALLVLCSSVSAKRPAVQEEIRLFRSRNPDRPVVPVIVEGTWPENFAPGLLYDISADGTLTDRSIVILAPDLHETGDGKRLGLAKIVAGLTGLETDEVHRRAERDRKRRVRRRIAVAVAFALTASSAAGSVFYAWDLFRKNAAYADMMLRAITDVSVELAAGAKSSGFPRDVVLSFLSHADNVLTKLMEKVPPTSELIYRKATTLFLLAQTYGSLGDTSKELDRASEALHLLKGWIAENPQDDTYKHLLGIVYEEIGDCEKSRGDLAAATRSYQEALETIERLAQVNPANIDLLSKVTELQMRIVSNVQNENLRQSLVSFRQF